MTDFEIRSDGSMIISGYVNAVGRDSRPVMTPDGRVIEQIQPGAFAEALRAAPRVDVLLNHDTSRRIAGTDDGTAKLSEDSIGLRAEVIITDSEVISKAKSGDLRGWSFGFRPLSGGTELERRADKLPRRIIKHMAISEISLIDSRYNPCYAGTSVECRAESGADEEYRAEQDEMRSVSKFTVEELERRYKAAVLRSFEVSLYDGTEPYEKRYNPYHDPSNRRFTSGGGGGGGDYIFMVPNGRSGQGVLMRNLNVDDNKTASLIYHGIYDNSTVNNSNQHRLVNGVNQSNTNASFSGAEGTVFGKSGGYGTAYTLVSDSGENKLVRNDYILHTDDGRVLITGKSTAVPHKPKSSGIDYTKSQHTYAPEEIAGAKKGNPMSFSEADNGKANPKYSPTSYGYSHNCQSCVVTHEARIRGYDVQTLPKTSAVARELSYDTTLAWIDPTTGKKPNLTAISGDYGASLDTIVNPNERYSVQFSHSNGGHIITASRDDSGRVRLYDPQTNKVATGVTEINDYFRQHKARAVEYVRVDNLDFNIDVVNNVTKKY